MLYDAVGLEVEGLVWKREVALPQPSVVGQVWRDKCGSR